MSIIIRNLSEQLVDLVRDRILTGVVAPDRPIRQDALAAELGVSKIPLREALARLEQEGLLTSQANRGFTVRPLNAAEAEEVYALRLKLEPEMIALAARNGHRGRSADRIGHSRPARRCHRHRWAMASARSTAPFIWHCCARPTSR